MPETGAPTTTQVKRPPDPFAAQGGGVWTGAQWVPNNHPLAAGVGSPSSPPTTDSPSSGGGGALPPSAPPPSTSAPTSPVTKTTAPVSATTPPGFLSGAMGNIPTTITVNGTTYTIPAPPAINTTPGIGASPAASAPGLSYSPEDPMMGLVREQLVSLMNRANATPSLNDPTLKPAADAYSAAQERARRGMAADQAEALSARGIGSSGAADAAQRASWETMGQNIGEFNANLITAEQAARRQDLQSALGMANQLGMFKEQTQLQRDLATLDTETKVEIANLDAELKNAGLGLQERLGIIEAELKKYGIEVGGNMSLLQTVLENEFNYAQLNLQSQVANLDSATKLRIAEMDAALRQQGLSLQERLAALDAEVRRYGIDTQGDLGNLEIALRKELGIGQLKLGLLQTLLGNQFNYDTLGANLGMWAADQNAAIMNYFD